MSSSTSLLNPRAGYDIVAPDYSTWRWVEFWQQNERHIVTSWLRSLPPGKGLDAGAGIGLYSDAVATCGHTAVAVDVSLRMLAASRGRGRYRRLVQADVASLPLATASLDWVLCTRVLTHIADAGKAVRELARVLRPRGEVLITDIHPSHPYAHVHIETEQHRADVKTHKHGTSAIRQVASNACLKELEYRELVLADLAWIPPRQSFAKLYADPQSAIFYVLRLQR